MTTEFSPTLLKQEYENFATTFSARKIEEIITEIREANLKGETSIWVDFKNGEPDEVVIHYFTNRGFSVGSPSANDDSVQWLFSWV